MRLKHIHAVTDYGPFGNAALLLLRITAGIAFAIHGFSKIQNPFSWAGPDSPLPGFLLALAALSEFGGGIAWVLGLLTPLASFGIACTMAVAFSFHTFVNGDPFVSREGPSSELAAIYFCIALVLLALGPGLFAADRKLFGLGARRARLDRQALGSTRNPRTEL